MPCALLEHNNKRLLLQVNSYGVELYIYGHHIICVMYRLVRALQTKDIHQNESF